jgi:hypothetical protein
MHFPEHALVVLVSTLAGGVERLPANHTSSSGGTCGRGGSWADCEVLDALVRPEHMLVPWCLTLGGILFLGLPTLLLRSRHKEAGLMLLAWTFLQSLGLVLCSLFATDHPVLNFALSLHSCARLLGRMRVSDRLVGGRWWWLLRYLLLAQLLAWEALAGPPVSVVRWPATPEGAALPCAFFAHLAGSVAPDLVLCLLDALGGMGSCILASGD